MAKYKIEIKKSAEKELRKVPKKDIVKIIQNIKRLSDDPRPLKSTKLTNQEKYRIRIGNYRVLYTIKDNILTVIVIKVGHRRDVYKDS